MNIVAEAQRANAPTAPPQPYVSKRDIIDEMGDRNVLEFKWCYDGDTIAERIKFCESWIPRIKAFRFKGYAIALTICCVMIIFNILSDQHVQRSRSSVVDGEVVEYHYSKDGLLTLGPGDNSNMALGELPGMLTMVLASIFGIRFMVQKSRRRNIKQFLLWYDSLMCARTIHDEQMKKAVPFETWLDGAIPEWRDRNPADVAQHIITSRSADDIFLRKMTPDFLHAPWDGVVPSDGHDETKYPPEYRPVENTNEPLEEDLLKNTLEYTINELVLPGGPKGRALRYFEHACSQFETKSTQLLGLRMGPDAVDQCLSMYSEMKRILQTPCEDEEQYIDALWKATMAIGKSNRDCGVANLPWYKMIAYKSTKCWFAANARASQYYALRSGRVTRVNISSGEYTANALLSLAQPNLYYQAPPTMIEKAFNKTCGNIRNFALGAEIVYGRRDAMGRLVR